MIRKAIVNDLDQIVDVHLVSFPDSVLSSLGRGFLKTFYKEFIIDDKGCCFVSIGDDGVAGFIVGVISPSDFFKRAFKRKWLHFALCSLRSIIKNPPIIIKLLRRAATHPNKSPKGDNIALLWYIAVLYKKRNKKIGEELVKNFLNELNRRGVEEVILATPRFNNDKVIKFYQKIGFRIKNSITTYEGREMYEFAIKLNDKL